MKKYIKPIVCITAIQSELVVCASIPTGGEQSNVTAEVTRRQGDEFDEDFEEDELENNLKKGWGAGLW